MASLRLEHVNVMVREPERTAAIMEQVFGWRERWRGPSLNGGRTIHVGTGDHYIALYAPLQESDSPDAFAKGRPLNHIGVEVDDLNATEAKVAAIGLRPFNHGDYNPGRRFYFLDLDGIEFEVVSYG